VSFGVVVDITQRRSYWTGLY